MFFGNVGWAEAKKKGIIIKYGTPRSNRNPWNFIHPSLCYILEQSHKMYIYAHCNGRLKPVSNPFPTTLPGLRWLLVPALIFNDLPGLPLLLPHVCLAFVSALPSSSWSLGFKSHRYRGSGWTLLLMLHPSGGFEPSTMPKISASISLDVHLEPTELLL